MLWGGGGLTCCNSRMGWSCFSWAQSTSQTCQRQDRTVEHSVSYLYLLVIVTHLFQLRSLQTLLTMRSGNTCSGSLKRCRYLLFYTCIWDEAAVPVALIYWPSSPSWSDVGRGVIMVLLRVGLSCHQQTFTLQRPMFHAHLNILSLSSTYDYPVLPMSSKGVLET